MTTYASDAEAPAGLRGRLRERLWRVAAAATHPLDPADYLDMFRPLRPGADLRARVVEVRPETADAVTVVLRPGAAWRGHQPGQYVRIGLEVDGVRLWRSYSLTSAPGERTAHHHGEGRSRTAWSAPTSRRSLRPGQLVHLDQAVGRLRASRPGAAQGPLRHRRQRHHPGDGHAAVRPGPARRCGSRALRGLRRRRDLR